MYKNYAFLFYKKLPDISSSEMSFKHFLSLQKLLRISCQSVLISRKISGIFYAKSREKYMEFEKNNKEFEGKRTRNLKEKHREFFTRA
jgi:hypothetical protein